MIALKPDEFARLSSRNLIVYNFVTQKRRSSNLKARQAKTALETNACHVPSTNKGRNDPTLEDYSKNAFSD